MGRETQAVVVAETTSREIERGFIVDWDIVLVVKLDSKGRYVESRSNVKKIVVQMRQKSGGDLRNS